MILQVCRYKGINLEGTELDEILNQGSGVVT